MSELDTVGLYLVVFVLIFGFLMLFKFAMDIKRLSDTMDDQREVSDRTYYENQYPVEYYEFRFPEDQVEINWKYEDFDLMGEVTFDDPADAYEYVVARLVEADREIDYIEGEPKTSGSFRWCDAYEEREYWLTNLKGFRV